MLTHKEIMNRVCSTEFDLDSLVERIDSLEKRVKKLEKQNETTKTN